MFIYVFSNQDKELLLENGYTLMKSDDQNGIYIFLAESDEQKNQEMYNQITKYCINSTLTF